MGWARCSAASSQFPASPCVLELAKARVLLFPQQSCQSLGEPRRNRALVQVTGNLPLDVGNVGAVLGFTHGRPPNDLPESVCHSRKCRFWFEPLRQGASEREVLFVLWSTSLPLFEPVKRGVACAPATAGDALKALHPA
jgi:hypothetical protein